MNSFLFITTGITKLKYKLQGDWHRNLGANWYIWQANQFNPTRRLQPARKGRVGILLTTEEEINLAPDGWVRTARRRRRQGSAAALASAASVVQG